ncbi:unnamed protein product [Miscanthus lutarioriparius]|uniref:Kinesin motor domain-containing protein n=1 Tax=Miscanthus lutarioriparius TaxID=422564 RepID=A0A811Q778_9POAL|nr:unnamed protein product [Miscanthus lutarioriparius]
MSRCLRRCRRFHIVRGILATLKSTSGCGSAAGGHHREDHSMADTAAPTDDEPSVKVVVRVRPMVSRPVDGKDLWFIHRTAPDSVTVRGGWRPQRQGLSDSFSDYLGSPPRPRGLRRRRASVGTSSAAALPSPFWPPASPRREVDLLREEEAGCDARRQAHEHGLQLKLKKSSELAKPDKILAGVRIDPSSNTRSRMLTVRTLEVGIQLRYPKRESCFKPVTLFCGSREVIILLDSGKAVVNLLLSLLLLEKSKSCKLLLAELNLIAEFHIHQMN